MSLVSRYLDWQWNIVARFSGINAGITDLAAIGLLIWLARDAGWLNGFVYLIGAAAFIFALISKIRRPIMGACLSMGSALAMVVYVFAIDAEWVAPVVVVGVFSWISCSQRILLRNRVPSEEQRL